MNQVCFIFYFTFTPAQYRKKKTKKKRLVELLANRVAKYSRVQASYFGQAGNFGQFRLCTLF